MQYGCIGEHLPHSFSKIIHTEIGEYAYDLKELSPTDLDAFMRARDFRAINVTIPYKQAVIPYLDTLSPRARAIGAVNTVVNRGGVLCGYNTDHAGMTMLARRAGIDLAGKRILILGTGGTARTAIAVARDGGAVSVLCASRTPSGAAISYREAILRAKEIDVIVNTTPCGMFPNVDGAAIDLSHFPALCGVIDAVYNPLKTELILQAEARGIPAAGGLYMLVAQAVEAARLFTDRQYPDALTERIFLDILRKKRNLVLIGMPSCGKTTIGRLLAERTKRPLIDTDETIRAERGASAEEIIRASGIRAFREEERRVVRDLAASQGVLIATGGGVPLDEANVRDLKKNGVLIWLDRPLSLLRSTSDRPLSDSADKLRALYEERVPIYRRACDLRIDAAAAPDEIVSIIEKSGLI